MTEFTRNRQLWASHNINNYTIVYLYKRYPFVLSGTNIISNN